MGRIKKRGAIFSSSSALALIATQYTLLVIDLKFNLDNDEKNAGHTYCRLLLGGGIDHPLQASARGGVDNGVGGDDTLNRIDFFEFMLGMRTEEVSHNNKEEKTFFIPLTIDP